MKEITVIGAGAAGVALIEKIRAGDARRKITLIDKCPYGFNKKDFICTFSLKNWLDLKSWTRDKDVDFICDTVTRVNASRRKIYFKEGACRDFEVLVVSTGLESRRLPVAGEHREGFFYLSAIDPFKSRGLLKVSSEAAVYVSTFLGLRLVRALIGLGKEVLVLGPAADFLGAGKERVISFLREKNVSVYFDVTLEEAIGERIIRAVKISPLKVFSSQLLFIDSGFSSNGTFFEQDLARRGYFFSDHEEVYFLGDVNYPDVEREDVFLFNYEEAKMQASVLADFILDGTPAVFQRRSAAPEDKAKIIDGLFNVGITV